FWVLRGGATTCGGTQMKTSEVLFVNGLTGAASQPVPALEDICWDMPSFNYPTSQWDFGTIYIGDFTSRYRGNEAIVIPYYATEGTVWNFADAGRWQRVIGPTGRDSLGYPSTPAYDAFYNSVKPSPSTFATT